MFIAKESTRSVAYVFRPLFIPYIIYVGRLCITIFRNCLCCFKRERSFEHTYIITFMLPMIIQHCSLILFCYQRIILPGKLKVRYNFIAQVVKKVLSRVWPFLRPNKIQGCASKEFDVYFFVNVTTAFTFRREFFNRNVWARYIGFFESFHQMSCSNRAHVKPLILN